MIHPDQRNTFAQGTEALRLHLDTASKTKAAQEFRHTAQQEVETVSDFIRRLERTFRTAYSRDVMSGDQRHSPVWSDAGRVMPSADEKTSGVRRNLSGSLHCGKERKAPCRPEEEPRVLSALHWYHTMFTMPTLDHAVCWLF